MRVEKSFAFLLEIRSCRSSRDSSSPLYLRPVLLPFSDHKRGNPRRTPRPPVRRRPPPDLEKNRFTLQGHKGVVYACRFAPSGDRLASCSADGTVRMWNVLNVSKGGRHRMHCRWVLDPCAVSDTFCRSWAYIACCNRPTLPAHSRNSRSFSQEWFSSTPRFVLKIKQKFTRRLLLPALQPPHSTVSPRCCAL